MVIYLVTTIEKMTRDRLGYPDFGKVQAVAFYADEEYARQAVIENRYDIHEYIYDYAVIETVEDGLHPDVLKRQFFKYNQKTEEYEEMDEPETAWGVTNFIIA